MPPFIKAIIKSVIAVTVLIGLPTNLYILFVKGDASGAFGLAAGSVALYFVAKVFEINKSSVVNNDR